MSASPARAPRCSTFAMLSAARSACASAAPAASSARFARALAALRAGACRTVGVCAGRRRVHLGQLGAQVAEQLVGLGGALALVGERALERLDLGVRLGEVAVQGAPFLDPLAGQRLQLRARLVELLTQTRVRLAGGSRLGDLRKQLGLALLRLAAPLLALRLALGHGLRELVEAGTCLVQLWAGRPTAHQLEAGLELADPLLGPLELAPQTGRCVAGERVLDGRQLRAHLLQLREQALVGTMGDGLGERLDTGAHLLESGRRSAA